MIKDLDTIGSFYLGKLVDPVTEKTTDKFLLYDSKNLTTHAVCVGMTGSGKTGLGIAVLEEAALDKIPAIIIDPKGDLTNLALTFPDLSAEEFFPWIDHAQAEKLGMTDQEYASFLAKTWSDGLLSSFENKQRIKKLKESVDIVIYTPASNAGIPLSILSSFKAPPENIRTDKEFMRERVLSLTSSLLGLLGIDADPIKSREHILISAILDKAFENGKDLEIANLIQQIQEPDFDKLGALDIETFFPRKERTALAVRLNALLASKSFQAWVTGEPLEIKDLLYTKEGKPKLSILSIAHLGDKERMFFVTLLLNEFIIWMRREPGVSSLKAILFMDEIFGFFPPIAMPPSKLPMLTLLKTARAFGVGIFLSTQNPVDLDYKGLSNCGTWFIGKLQTERDKQRILEGLRIASNGEFSTESLDKMISSIKKRVFIMRSIYEKEPLIFETRWTMSYLKGPLTLSQIQSLTKKTIPEPNSENEAITNTKPFLPQGTIEYFIKQINYIKSTQYKPYVLGSAKLHFVDAKNKVDLWKNVYLLFPIDSELKTIDLNKGEKEPDIKERLERKPVEGSTFEDFPVSLVQEKNLSLFQKAFIASLYQNETLVLYQIPSLGLTSKPEESKEDFHARVLSAGSEKVNLEVKKTEEKYNEKIAAIEVKFKKADDKLSLQKNQSFIQKIEAFLSFLTTLFQAFLGKRLTKGTLTQVGTSMRKAGRLTKESQDEVYAEDSLKSYETQISDLKQSLQDEITKIKADSESILNQIEEIAVKPRKSDIVVDEIALVWSP